MPSSAGGLPGSGDTDDGADATGKLSGAVSARWPAESPPAGVPDWSLGAGGAGAAACTGVAGACVSSDADDEWCVMTDPTMMMAMTAAAAIAIRRVAGRYHHGSNEPATAAMSVVNMAADAGD